MMGGINSLPWVLVLVVGVFAATYYIIKEYGIRRVREIVITTAQIAAVLTLVASIVSGLFIGFPMGSGIGRSIALSRPSGFEGDKEFLPLLFGVIGAMLGAVISFVVAALPIAVLFLLIEISVNTRRKP